MRRNYGSEGRAVGMNGSLIKDMGTGRDEKECEGLYSGWLKCSCLFSLDFLSL